MFADDDAGTSLDQRVSRFHHIQSISVDNSLPRTSTVLTGMPRRASVLFILLHGGMSIYSSFNHSVIQNIYIVLYAVNEFQLCIVVTNSDKDNNVSQGNADQVISSMLWCHCLGAAVACHPVGRKLCCNI